ncbi:MAG: hypothetical protein ABFS08_04125 [Pseudomonadota bacterium]
MPKPAFEVQLGESFRVVGLQVDSAKELLPVLKQALRSDSVKIVDCRVDYRENLKLTTALGGMVCPI